MKKIAVVAFLLFHLSLYSQNKDSIESKKNTIFIEACGNAIKGIDQFPNMFSLNYDRVLTNAKAHNISIRVGGNYSFQYNEKTIAVLLNYIYGRKNHHLELGCGYINVSNIKYWVVVKRPKNYGAENIITSSIQYRYQRPSGGLFAKVGLTPTIRYENDDYALLVLAFFRVGTSFGLTF
jgi:hypothetical protein